MTRYALYYAPAPDSRFWQAGSRWLGRDAASGAPLPQPDFESIPTGMLAQLTTDARRYGFHATLKAPFHLAPGFTEDDLLLLAQTFAERHAPVPIGPLQPQLLRQFLSLRPAAGRNDALQVVAMRCVRYVDLLRAPPSADELARRHSAGLTVRQQALLERWGYPYVEEAYRFHMTLTDSLRGCDATTVKTLHRHAADWFADAADTTDSGPAVDALTLFRQDMPGAPFIAWRRFPLTGHATATLPAPGRLFYLVGPSGSGKDTLLDWVRQRLPNDTNIRIARRVITRPASPSEAHEPMDPDRFAQRVAEGCFSLVWHANGLSYGVRRSIEAALLAGRDVIVNGSREFVPTLKQRFPQAKIIWVDADPALLQRRIESRGRESGDAVARRLQRAVQFAPSSADVLRIDNNGPVEQAGSRFMQLLGRRSG